MDYHSETNKDNFYLYVPSDVDTAQSHRNTSSSFVVPLKDNIYLENSKWEVALKEIFYPDLWYNITESDNEIITGRQITRSEITNESKKEGTSTPALTIKEQHARFFNSPDAFLNSFQSRRMSNRAREVTEQESQVWSLTIPPGNYTPSDLVSAINSMMRKGTNSSFGGQLRYSSRTGKLVVSLNAGDMFCVRSVNLARVLGLSERKRLVLNTNSARMKKKITFPSALDFSTNSSNMYVYTNFIRYSAIGNTTAPVLRVLQLHHNNNERYNNNYQSFLHSQYHTVTKNVLTNIEIELRDSVGNLIPFQRGKTLLVLHFRRKGAQILY